MPVATKSQLIALRGPGPLVQSLQIAGTEMTVMIKGIVRSAEREQVYDEITEMSALRAVTVGGERISITEDDIVAACWAARCVRQPVLTAMEWLMVGANNADLLSLVGFRSLVCSRLASDDQVPDGCTSAALVLSGDHDPLDFSPSSSVSTSLEGCLENLIH